MPYKPRFGSYDHIRQGANKERPIALRTSEQRGGGRVVREKFLGWFTKRLAYRVISADHALGPLLIRYFLIRTKYIGVYLHRLCRSDEDRALHDHPWTFISLLLTEGYQEHTPSGIVYKRPGSLLYRPAKWRHRLELTKPVWTLVIRFRRCREWGFHCPQGFVHWQQFDKRGGCE